MVLSVTWRTVISIARYLIPGALSVVDKTMEETFMKFSKSSGITVYGHTVQTYINFRKRDSVNIFWNYTFLYCWIMSQMTILKSLELLYKVKIHFRWSTWHFQHIWSIPKVVPNNLCSCSVVWDYSWDVWHDRRSRLSKGRKAPWARDCRDQKVWRGSAECHLGHRGFHQSLDHY